MVDNVQIYDRQSDQSAFTGFDDGNSQKTMNITTRSGRSEGYFGKVYAGYGTDDRFITGGNLNIFHGNRRISLLALSNNINQQNFSAQDLLGVTGGGGSGFGSGGGGRGMFGGGTQGGSAAGNFLTGQQGGISTTNSFGVNYSDQWGKKIKFSGSYFFNGSDNTASNQLTRTYTDSSQNVYNERSATETVNSNHRINLRLEYTIDSFNSLIFTPSLNIQNNDKASGTQANDSIMRQLVSLTDNRSHARNSGYNSNNNLLLQHKFRKKGRTLSLNLSSVLNDKSGDGSYYSLNQYYRPEDTTLFDQRYDLANQSFNYGASLNYTEPAGKRGQLQVNYSPSVTQSHSDKETYDRDTTGNYDVKDIQLSNKYDNTYTTHRGGLAYRYSNKGANLMIGVNAQDALLQGQQDYPYTYSVNKEFFNVLPSLMFNKRYTNGRNLRIRYNTSTTAPTVSQLQTVTDISNPLLLKTGNADLKQTFEHNLIVRIAKINAMKGRSLFAFANANVVENYIGNAIYLPFRDSVFTDQVTGSSVEVKRGSQLTRPVNLNGYYSLRGYAAVGLPVTAIKSNLNLSMGISATHTPGLLNNVLNYTDNLVPSFGIVLGSNISQNIDFSLSYTGNYNVVNNTTNKNSNNNYYNHVAGFKINWIVLKRIVFNSNITHNYYTAFSSTGNQSFWLWNTYVAYKFLKNNGLEARVSAFDLLNQNTSISRTVTANYIENNVTQVLKQYFLFQLTYTIRNFKGRMPEESKFPFEGMMPPGGLRPPPHGDGGH
ncbi:MAG: TonB-dependent receptor [Chitinophagia bacterium]|nr:TonB-dependent receptor [Chitinophagia bacterium]